MKDGGHGTAHRPTGVGARAVQLRTRERARGGSASAANRRGRSSATLSCARSAWIGPARRDGRPAGSLILPSLLSEPSRAGGRATFAATTRSSRSGRGVVGQSARRRSRASAHAALRTACRGTRQHLSRNAAPGPSSLVLVSSSLKPSRRRPLRPFERTAAGSPLSRGVAVAELSPIQQLR